METESQRERDVMGNHIPFLVLKSGNISRKFVTKKMRSCDKNFGQLQLKQKICKSVLSENLIFIHTKRLIIKMILTGRQGGRMDNNEKWLQWAVELQSLAQAGIFYGKDVFDKERYERIREIAAEMISYKTDISMDKVKNLFCNEIGYQTPKIDCRAAVFQNDKILLVQEKNGTWSLPGGWVDVHVSVKENVMKEVKEEAGLDVMADMVIAIQDREKHNLPVYAYKVCKIFVLCSVIGGEFKSNIETISSNYFGMNELPILATEKNNEEQIKMCFEAYQSENWKTFFD